MTELEKLKRADTLIRDMSEGRLQLAISFGNHFYVRPKDDTYIGMAMMTRGNVQQMCLIIYAQWTANTYTVTFDAHVRRMGTPMTAVDLGKLATEVLQTQALLAALEIYRFQPTQKDMDQFHDYLLDRPQYGHTQPQQEQVNSEMVM